MATDATTTQKNGPSDTQFIDPATLMRIQNLQARARVVVEGFYAGLHRSPYHGFSVEFSEYREYSPGDDLRYLDWKLFARSDRYYIKRFEDETNLRCQLVLDLSHSMDYGSISYTKAEYARSLAATLTYFLMQQRDCVGLLTFSDELGDYLPPRYRPGHLHRLMVALERAATGKSTDLHSPLEHVARLATKRGWIVIISDLLTPLEDLKRKFGFIVSRGHEVIVMRVLDPQEIEFDFQDASLFLDAESGRQLYVDPNAARERYLENFRKHAEEVSQTCADLGIELHTISTERPLELSLFDFLHDRMKRGKVVSRRRGAQRQGGSQ